MINEKHLWNSRDFFEAEDVRTNTCIIRCWSTGGGQARYTEAEKPMINFLILCLMHDFIWCTWHNLRSATMVLMHRYLHIFACIVLRKPCRFTWILCDLSSYACNKMAQHSKEHKQVLNLFPLLSFTVPWCNWLYHLILSNAWLSLYYSDYIILLWQQHS